MEYTEINRDAWNKKTTVHIGSEFYDNESFLQGKNTLKEIELDFLGDITGKTILHLQCHFGQDTISMSRMGAKVTGVDLSDVAIEKAREFALRLETDTRFIRSDIYDLPDVLDEKFDIVYTSYGVIGWLPDMKRWAEVVARFLRPGGLFVFVEFHPFVYTFDDEVKKVTYRYFTSESIVEEMSGSYADRDADVFYSTVSWNHSLSEVIDNLLRAGISLTRFEEFDYSPYNCFVNTIKVDKDKYRIAHMKDMIPLTYALKGEMRK